MKTDPFHCCVNTTERLDKVKRLSLGQLEAALLYTGHLQATVKKAIHSRIKRLRKEANHE